MTTPTPASLDLAPHLSTDQLAARLGTSTGALATWRYRGLGPAYVKAGSRVLYMLADVLAWEAAHRVNPGDKVS